MKISVAVSFGTLLAAAVAKPVNVKIAKKQAGYGGYSPKPYGSLQPYGSPPAYVSSSNAYHTAFTTTAPPLTTASSTVCSPIGVTNSSSALGSTGYTPSFSSRPRTGTFTESSTLVLTLTITASSLSLFTGPSSSFPNSNSTRPPYPTGTGAGSTTGNPVIASSYLTTGATSTVALGTTSYITVFNTTTPGFTPSFSSRPRTGTCSLTGTGTASFPISPVIPTSTVIATFWNSTLSSFTDTGTGYSSSPSSTIGSPVTNTHNSSTVAPTGSFLTTLYPTAYPTAPAPYGYLTLSLSTGVSSSRGTEGSPIFPNSTTSSGGIGDFPTPYASSYGTGTAVISSLGSTEISPITAPSSSTGTPTFASRPRYPGTGSTTSTITNLETFPTIVPDSTTSPYSLVPTGSLTASSGFTAVTTTAPAPPGYGSPIPYATSSYAGPGSYPYSHRGKQGGGWWWSNWGANKDW